MPMDPNVHFSIEQCPSMPNQSAQMQGVPYIEAIRSVLWPAVVSRPDIVFAVGIRSVHWEALKQIILYLKTTKDLWLTFGKKSKTLVEC